ncbi:MAG: histidinol-phosphate transaminase [Candidatus Promineifilaceae bacterium]
MQHLVRPDIVAMKPYTPILPFEVRSQQMGRDPQDIVKLDANENPYGCSPAALTALQNAEFLHIYPDPEARALREALSAYVGISAERLVCGLGADELIDIVLRVVLNPNDVVVDCPPSFGMYPFSTHVNGGQYVVVRRSADFSLDVDAIEQTVREQNAKVLFLCSPNNPNGSIIDDATLRRLLQLPCLVVLDEAYVEFSALDGHTSRIGWCIDYDNLAVLRTFSKLAGLAGIRIGYGGFPSWLIPHMMKIKQPYNVTVAADRMARGALEDQTWLSEKVSAIVAERKRMVAALEEFAFLQPYPSYSNFVLFRVMGRDAGQLKRDLEGHGILVRYFAKEGVDNCIRISAGRPQDTARLVEALRALA